MTFVAERNTDLMEGTLPIELHIIPEDGSFQRTIKLHRELGLEIVDDLVTAFIDRFRFPFDLLGSIEIH